MKKVKIINKLGQEFGNITEDPTEWINNCVSNSSWGKTERWQLASEPHDDADIIGTESRVDENGIPKLWVQLCAEYTIEITDLDQDYDWLLEECYKNRRSEYPPLSELGDALFHKEVNITR